MSMRERKQTLQSIGWIRDQHRAGLLDLDPPYQRRSVWNKDYRQYFIDSILNNYPVPPIFVNTEVTDEGSIVYHVVDGKQRLLAVLEFLKDAFPLSPKYAQDALAGKYFSDLEDTTKRRFYGFFLPFEVFSDLSPADLKEIFDRFNRNVLRLNDQELRHARFGGKFITLMEQLADEPFWRECGVISPADLRRMKDVEYVSVLFILTMHGIQDGDDLDTFYANYDEDIPDVGEHLARFKQLQEMTMQLQDTVRSTRLRNKADFYSLLSALRDFSDAPKEIDYGRTSEHLVALSRAVDAVAEAEAQENVDKDAAAYSLAVRAGTTKHPNRVTRQQLLKKCIVTA